MKIVLIEPFMGGSHQAWAEGYQRHSRHEVALLTLPGRHWKWRMHGAAVTLARRYRELTFTPDLIVATDMLDVTTFIALAGQGSAHSGQGTSHAGQDAAHSGQGPAHSRQGQKLPPVALYFHENQMVYPWSPDDPDPQKGGDSHYSFINYVSALAAAKVLFNSAWHKSTFLEALTTFLDLFPDFKEKESIAEIAIKSEVLPLGLDLRKLQVSLSPDASKSAHSPTVKGNQSGPLILWNHRWEYDKNPADFFEALYALQVLNIPFRLAVLGESFSKTPHVFEEARLRLQTQIVHWGFVPDRESYAMWLKRADILPVTSRQDFFGISAVEAIGCGCYPLLPARLAFPEHIPPTAQQTHLYGNQADLQAKLIDLVKNWDAEKARSQRSVFSTWADRYDWLQLATVYDDLFETIIH